MIELLKEMCKIIEDDLNSFGESGHTVKLVYELKKHDYFYNHVLPRLDLQAWFLEIWVDNKCIFRESCIQEDDPETILVYAMLRKIFHYGIESAKAELQKRC